jgi:prophage maintenance system killer protein
MLTFLRLNAYDVEATPDQRAGWILQLSEGATGEDLAETIRAVLIPCF